MPKPTDLNKQAFMFTDDIKFLQKAVIFHPENHNLFLALKRSPNAHSRPNEWDLTGGNVLYGEMHDDSLRKEIKEESGLEVEELIPAQVITKYDEQKDVYTIFIGFSCRARNKEVEISEEHIEYRWVNRQELIDLNPAQFLIDLVEAVFKKI